MAEASTLHPEIFGAYDIRGVYPETLDDNAGYAIGRAMVRFLAVSQVAVGRDMRLSSPALAAAIIGSVFRPSEYPSAKKSAQIPTRKKNSTSSLPVPSVISVSSDEVMFYSISARNWPSCQLIILILCGLSRESLP